MAICSVHVSVELAICIIRGFFLWSDFYRIDLFAAVGGTCKDSGVSQLAKSLFASVPRRTTNMVVASQPLNCCDVTGEGSSFHDIKNVQQHYHVFYDGMSAPRNSRLPAIGLLEF